MRRTRMPMVAAIIVGMIGLSACGPAPWNDAGSTPTPTATRTAPVPEPVSNDLSSGSTERELTAGAVAASIDYWSTLSMDRWTPTALKPISLSLTTTVTPDDGKKVFLQRASMVAVPGNATKSFEPLPAQVDQSSSLPQGYLVLSPQSYSQTFTIGELPAAATFVTVQFTYEFLMQTTPTSSEYAKQTATDTLTVAIAAEPGDEDTGAE